ncbi:MAG TPA: SDR family oxidoreductase [Bacteroidota bacterium]|nr:SDR family oxidoreductase [Bacteroidota bacterium]
MNLNLQGKTALITGGSRGIGKAIAIAFASEGMRIGICGRDEEQLQQAEDDIRNATRTEVLAVKANMTKANDVRRFISAGVKKFHRVDVLVNNAGGAHVGGILGTTDEDWEYHLQLKLLGYIRAAREILPHFQSNGGGKIINIIGMAGKEPPAHFLVPGVTNAGLISFTKAVAREFAGSGIFVNGINPATVDTPLTVETFKSLAERQNKTVEEIRTSASAASPAGRLASPEEIAKAALFLASEASNYINGETINVDAGRSAGMS